MSNILKQKDLQLLPCYSNSENMSCITWDVKFLEGKMEKSPPPGLCVYVWVCVRFLPSHSSGHQQTEEKGDLLVLPGASRGSHTHTHTNTHTHTHTHTQTNTHTQTHRHIDTDKHIHTHSHTHNSTHTHTYTYAHTHTHINIDLHIHKIQFYTHIH